MCCWHRILHSLLCSSTLSLCTHTSCPALGPESRRTCHRSPRLVSRGTASWPGVIGSVVDTDSFATSNVLMARKERAELGSDPGDLQQRHMIATFPSHTTTSTAPARTGTHLRTPFFWAGTTGMETCVGLQRSLARLCLHRDNRFGESVADHMERRFCES